MATERNPYEMKQEEVANEKERIIVDDYINESYELRRAGKTEDANAIDKVEVLRNFSEVGQMRGVTNNQDNVAINIKLKEGKKNFWFGEVTAGSGVDADVDPRYLLHPKLFIITLSIV